MMSRKETIESALALLIGKALWGAGRAADLETFAFGERRTVPDFRGKLREVGEHALHVQCAWHIAGPHGIVVASRDRYYPRGNPGDVPEGFEWDRPGANLCDERIEEFFRKQPEGYAVSDVKADVWGGLRLSLEGGFLLAVFPDNSLREEHWRFFVPGAEAPHFVVDGEDASWA